MNPSPDALPPDDLPPSDWVTISSYHSFSSADEHALVLLATGHECWLHPHNSEFSLLVPPSTALSAHRQITQYENERRPPSPHPQETSRFRHQSSGTVQLWLILLLLGFTWQTADPTLIERGLSSSQSLFNNHEWWRPFTALFLHSDFPHLLGNLLGGALFGSFVIRSIGPILGLFTILASGTLGNLLNAFLHYPDEHRSLGASTSVFGALGILAALGFAELLRHPHTLPWRRIVAPLIGGFILLGWMGGGSPDSLTDVGAHIAGFLSGLTLGALCAAFPSRHS